MATGKRKLENPSGTKPNDICSLRNTICISKEDLGIFPIPLKQIVDYTDSMKTLYTSVFARFERIGSPIKCNTFFTRDNAVREEEAFLKNLRDYCKEIDGIYPVKEGDESALAKIIRSVTDAIAEKHKEYLEICENYIKNRDGKLKNFLLWSEFTPASKTYKKSLIEFEENGEIVRSEAVKAKEKLLRDLTAVRETRVKLVNFTVIQIEN